MKKQNNIIITLVVIGLLAVVMLNSKETPELLELKQPLTDLLTEVTADGAVEYEFVVDEAEVFVPGEVVATGGCCATYEGCASGPTITEEVCQVELNGKYYSNRKCNMDNGACE